MVSKDFSKLIVDNAYLENNSLCAAAYNKKQEFGPSYIAIPKKLCPKEELAIQNNSILEKMIPRIEQKLELKKHHYLDLLKWINHNGGGFFILKEQYVQDILTIIICKCISIR